MKIQVEGKVFIESDERQFVLKEYTGKFDNKGNEISKTFGYFGSVSQALKHFLKLEIMKSDASNINELIADINKIESKIDAILKRQ